MARILVVGDSQSVEPGKAALRALEAQGHKVRRVSNVGMGPHDYVRLPSLWEQYVDAVKKFKPDLIILIFGTNDAPNQKLHDSLLKLKTSVKPKVILTGPPQYPAADRQANGAKVRDIYKAAFGDDYFDSYPHTDSSLRRDGLGLHLLPSSAAAWGTAIAQETLRVLTL